MNWIWPAYRAKPGDRPPLPARSSSNGSNWRWPTLLCLFCAGMLMAGCTSPTASQDNKGAPSQPSAENPFPLRSHIAARTASLVAGNASAATNTGRDTATMAAVLTNDGYLLTAAHGVPSVNFYILLLAPDGKHYFTIPRIVWIGTRNDPTVDLAVLKIEVPLRAAFEWASDEEFPAGSEVVSAGWRALPTPNNLIYAAGAVLDPAYRRSSRAAGPITSIAHSASLRQSDSGGPLVTPDGRLVGINTRIEKSLLGRPRYIALRPDLPWLLDLIARDRLEHPPTMPAEPTAQPSAQP